MDAKETHNHESDCIRVLDEEMGQKAWEQRGDSMTRGIRKSTRKDQKMDGMRHCGGGNQETVRR